MPKDQPVDETTDTAPPAEQTPEEVTIDPTPETEAAVYSEPAPLATDPAPESSYDLDEDLGAGDNELVVETTPEFTSAETAQLNALPTPGTVEDPAGIERIVVPDLGASGWKPAQVEPDPDEVARLERMQAGLAAKKQERLESLQVKS